VSKRAKNDVNEIKSNNYRFFIIEIRIVMKNKTIKLRAFNIVNVNQSLTMPDFAVLSLLEKALKQKIKVQDRRMKLNEQDNDEDVLSFFAWQQPSYLFGMMLRIIPAENGGVIPDALFDREILKINDLKIGNVGERQYKDHYYFALNNNFLVTNLPGTYSIDRFQTYINWLLSDVRGDNYFEANPLTTIPEGVKVSDISSIEFGGVKVSTNMSPSNEGRTFTKITEIARECLKSLMSDTALLENIQEEDLVSAKLLLKIKAKPESMAEDDYKKIMSAMTRQITNDSGISIVTKDKKRYDGRAIKVVKEVNVEMTKGGRIVEEQLKQKMESFLRELNAQKDNG